MPARAMPLKSLACFACTTNASFALFRSLAVLPLQLPASTLDARSIMLCVCQRALSHRLLRLQQKKNLCAYACKIACFAESIARVLVLKQHCVCDCAKNFVAHTYLSRALANPLAWICHTSKIRQNLLCITESMYWPQYDKMQTTDSACTPVHPYWRISTCYHL